MSSRDIKWRRWGTATMRSGGWPVPPTARRWPTPRRSSGASNPCCKTRPARASDMRRPGRRALGGIPLDQRELPGDLIPRGDGRGQVELHRSALPHARRVDARRAYDQLVQGLVCIFQRAWRPRNDHHQCPRPFQVSDHQHTFGVSVRSAYRRIACQVRNNVGRTK